MGKRVKEISVEPLFSELPLYTYDPFELTDLTALLQMIFIQKCSKLVGIGLRSLIYMQ